MHFADRLFEAVQSKGTPVCVGVDPRPELLPSGFLTVGEADAKQTASAIGRFSTELVELVASMVPVVKFQAAFFERLGVDGCAALHNAAERAVDLGLIVIIDGKRNDIGSTAEAYADAYLGMEVRKNPRQKPPWPGHALTINPYLGSDGIQPFLKAGLKAGKGAFCLVRTSNPSAKDFQDLHSDGIPIYQHVARRVRDWGEPLLGESGYSLLGAVVGATYPTELAQLRDVMPRVPFLVPGYGAQGGSAADVSAAFDGKGLGAIVNNSRGILSAHMRTDLAEKYQHDWKSAIVHAVREMIEDLAKHTPAGNLAG